VPNAPVPPADSDAIHRIGGGSVENLRLKPKETVLNPPGISVLKAATPGEAAAEIRAGYPDATGLHAAASTVGTSTAGAIRSAGFDMIPTPGKRLTNHHRIVHPDGASGFSDENLSRLSETFENSTGH